MIEKISLLEITDCRAIVEKVNELVDAVNDLSKYQEFKSGCENLQDIEKTNKENILLNALPEHCLKCGAYKEKGTEPMDKDITLHDILCLEANIMNCKESERVKKLIKEWIVGRLPIEENILDHHEKDHLDCPQCNERKGHNYCLRQVKKNLGID
jgi:hypothetical protein